MSRSSCTRALHPALSRGVGRRAFLREVASVLNPVLGGRWAVAFSPALGREHRRNPRRYAQVLVGQGLFLFEFAPQVLLLSRRHRFGLIAHEVGHALLGHRRHTEAEADRAAEAALGVRVGYDRRWPGKGLQRLV